MNKDEGFIVSQHGGMVVEVTGGKVLVLDWRVILDDIN